jgi:hypothetical protein
MAFVVPVKHVNNEHMELEPGDIIDPQFLPAAASNYISLAPELIPQLAPAVSWVSSDNYENTRPVIGNCQIVFYYWMYYTVTSNGLYLTVPSAIQDDQGRWYDLADVNLTASGDPNQPAVPLPYYAHFDQPIQLVSATPGEYHVVGSVSYIRQEISAT